ncbi:MAG: acylphosphatase [Terriglobales bacterium]
MIFARLEPGRQAAYNAWEDQARGGSPLFTGMMEAARFEVSGEVQGVGFRMFVLRLALDLKLTGWVRNRADTSVEVAAWGSVASLQQLEHRLRQGPPAARVREVRRSPWNLSAHQAAPTSFEIVH